MANSKPADTSNKIGAIDRQRSMMAEDSPIEGNIVSQAVLEFGGQITGNVTTDTANVIVSSDQKLSVMAEDILIEGNIVSQGVLEFGGQITGNLTADAVILTSTARVQGRVRTRTLTIEGDLRGAAIALHISVKKGSHVRANLAYETLEIEPGSNVTGEYTRISADTFKL